MGRLSIFLSILVCVSYYIIAQLSYVNTAIDLFASGGLERGTPTGSVEQWVRAIAKNTPTSSVGVSWSAKYSFIRWPASSSL